MIVKPQKIARPLNVSVEPPVTPVVEPCGKDCFILSNDTKGKSPAVGRYLFPYRNFPFPHCLRRPGPFVNRDNINYPIGMPRAEFVSTCRGLRHAMQSGKYPNKPSVLYMKPNHVYAGTQASKLCISDPRNEERIYDSGLS